MEILTINELISWIESRSFYGAVRFEPTVYEKITTPGPGRSITTAQAEILNRVRKINRCSASTAAMIYASSWGAYQIMGFNLYAAPNFDLTISEFQVSQRAQDAAFAAFLVGSGLQDFTPGNLSANHDARLKFSMKYNGSIDYEQPMIAALRHFNFQIS